MGTRRGACGRVALLSGWWRGPDQWRRAGQVPVRVAVSYTNLVGRSHFEHEQAPALVIRVELDGGADLADTVEVFFHVARGEGRAERATTATAA